MAFLYEKSEICAGISRLFENKELINLNIIENIAKAINLKESTTVIERFLLMLYFKQTKNTKVIAKELLIPVPIATAIKKECIKQNLISQGYGIILTEFGVNFVEKSLGYEGINHNLYHQLLTSENNNEYTLKLIQKMKDIFDNRPTVDVSIDQAHATIETAVKRAMLALNHQTLIGKKLLFIGDDDLISIAIGFLLKDLFPNKSKHLTKLVVVDISSELVSYIKSQAKKHQLPIDCYERDLRNPLPESLNSQFDAVFTDPPYTTAGLELFVSRGLSGLKKGLGYKIFLSYGNKAIHDTHEFQKIIIKSRLIIQSIDTTFNTYVGASLLGNQSQMITLATTKETRPTVKDEEEFQGLMYTKDINLLAKENRQNESNDH